MDLLSSIAHDIRGAVRSLIKDRAFTVVALLTLALAVGANTAIFTILDGVLLRPLPYRDADRVVMLWSHWTNWTKTWVSQPELADYQTQLQSLENVAGFSYTSFNLTGVGDPVRVRAAQVQAAMFPALGVQPIAGRVFTADEDRSGRERVVLLGEGIWRSQFGGDPFIVGRSIQLDVIPYQVIGILPESLRLPIDYATRSTTALWMPIAFGPSDPTDRGNHGYWALGRLRPGVGLARAQAEVDTLTATWRRTYSSFYDAEFGLTLMPAPDEVFGDVRPALLVLALAVGAVLLIACANVANLMLARSEARQKELAIRVVLGAGRGRIVRHVVTESLVLSSIGGLLGAAVAWGLTRTLVALDPLKIPRVQDLGLDARVLVFAAALSVVTGLLFAGIPAYHAARGDVQPALKEGGRESRVASGWVRRALVVGEVAASVALVAAAMLLARSFARLLAVDPGFDAAHVLTLRTSLPSTTYRDGASMVKAYVDVGRRLSESSGVAAAGAVTGLPLASMRGDWSIRIEGDPESNRLDRAADWQVVTPGYFEALGMRVVAGRTFTDADRADTLPVIVINEAMARKFWPDGRAIGRRLTMGSRGPWITVIGIVADVHHRGLDEPPRTEMYRPHTQFRYGADANAPAVSTMTWVLRTTADPRSAAGYARSAIREVDRDLGISDVATMTQVMNDATSDRRLDLVLFALLGGLALALATVGVYGVVAYSVSQRTHEIGVRMAIGAQPREVVRMVLSQGLKLGLAGVAIGSALALASARLVRGLLFQVSATDPSTYVAVAAGLVLVAVFASYVPARRATRVDPMVALRDIG